MNAIVGSLRLEVRSVHENSESVRKENRILLERAKGAEVELRQKTLRVQELESERVLGAKFGYFGPVACLSLRLHLQLRRA